MSVKEHFGLLLNRRPTCVIHLFAGFCNSKCLWCPRQYSLYSNYREGLSVSFVNLKKFLELNHDWKVPLIPYGSGEPTIHPNFVDYSTYVLEQGWELRSIHTNLSANLSDDVLRVLSCFRDVTVNFGGGTAEIQRINMGTDFNAVLGNLRRLLSFGGKVKIQVKMVLNRWNIASVASLQKAISEISSDIKVSTYPMYFAVSDGSKTDKWAFYFNNLADKDGKLNTDIPCRDIVTLKDGEVNSVSKLALANKCYGLNPTVHTDGSVTVCCRSRWYGGEVGNAFETPLREIFASDSYNEAMKKALRREYVEYCHFCS